MVTFREALDPSRIEVAARRFHEHQLDDPPEQVAQLIHEDAEMRLLVAHRRPLRGKRTIMEALEEGRAAELYSATVERTELLDENTVLVFGQARYAVEHGGVAHSAVWWVDRFRDGLLWRADAYLAEAEARTAYEAGGSGPEVAGEAPELGGSPAPAAG
jgi:hypothetical protein